MAENEVPTPDHSGAESDSPSDAPSDDEILYIHWKDEYWNHNDYDGKPAPQPETTHNTTWPGGGGNGSGHVDLWSANRDLAMHFVPVLATLAVVLLLTIMGNALVCLVYRTRFRRNSANLFVVLLAVLEMAIMLLGVPMEMVVLALPLKFELHVACRIFRYVETVSVCVVLLTLTAIAWDRYFKMTRPTHFRFMEWAKKMFIGAIVSALFLAIPAPILFGSKTVPLNNVNVTGVMCGVDDNMRSTPVRFVYVSLLILTFVVCFFQMAVLYTLMFIRIWRRRSAARGERVSPARREYIRKHRFVTEDSTSSCGGYEETRKLPTSSSGSGSSGVGSATTPRSGRTSPGIDPARVPLKSGVKESARIGQGASTTVDVQSTQMTRIFFIVSVVCVVSITPYLVLRTLQAVTDVLENVQPVWLVVLFEVGVRLHLLHAPIIPIIYLVSNHNFRREARILLQKVGRFCKRQPAPARNNR